MGTGNYTYKTSLALVYTHRQVIQILQKGLRNSFHCESNEYKRDVATHTVTQKKIKLTWIEIVHVIITQARIALTVHVQTHI